MRGGHPWPPGGGQGWPPPISEGKAQGLSLRACRIEDGPDFARRGVYHDCSRGKVPTLQTLLALLSALPSLDKADDIEILDFVERHRLMGRGIGLIEVHLLASCMLDGALLWTRDKRLKEVAAKLGLAHAPT